MPIGVIVNSLSVLFGGIIGAFLGDKVPERIRTSLPLILGIASMSMGITSIVKMNTLPAVILAVIVGTAIGELMKFEKGIEVWANKARGPIEKLFSSKAGVENQKEFMDQFVGIVILFCASGTGVFGALQSGMTGDHTILLAKSILDFCTAGIFATALGYMVAAIFIPQFIVLLILFLAASFIMSLTTPVMLADFTACGGILMLATGFRICGIKSFPIANMLPAMVIVMPLSWIWITYCKF
ncbi:MAG: hypothetical protein H6Q69_4186 [Firmicutes bacterium]|jgi:uncharacterized membrane protein YqgA involved in biofilm formation|nr:hypothetical protein [Bacillota bacterium]